MYLSISSTTSVRNLLNFVKYIYSVTFEVWAVTQMSLCIMSVLSRYGQNWIYRNILFKLPKISFHEHMFGGYTLDITVQEEKMDVATDNETI
jgi:hypothetical protein